jgi:hypothetical protein
LWTPADVLNAARPMRGGLRVLLISLLLLVGLSPFFTLDLVGRAIFLVIGTSVVLSGAYASNPEPRNLAIALLLAMPAVVTNWSGLLHPTPAMHVAGRLATMAFCTYTIFLLLGRLLRTEEVSIDEIYGAISIYVLIGIVWGIGYQVLDAAAPGSFNRALPRDDFDLMYYSFVTLLTVGYGDIHPATPYARSMTIIEAMVGVIYLAVFISRMVSMQTQGRRT